MLSDARDVPDRTVLDADVCTIGAGPAGLAIAHGLAGSGLDHLILESGDARHSAAAQALNDGPVSGDAYAGLRVTRSRGLGGTVRLWNTPVDGEPGAKLVPLDRHDLLPAAGQATGWPFERAQLDLWYARAHELCGIGPVAWDAADWPGERPPPLSDSHLANRIYQFGRAKAFTALLDALRSAADARLYTNATACALDFAGRRVTCIHAADPAGRHFRVRAKAVILCGGAIENARLLLASDDGGAMSGRAWLGRCFMEHPRDSVLTLEPVDAAFFAAAGFYDRHAAADGTIIAGRLALTDTALDTGLPNASVTLLPRLRKRSQPSGTAARTLAWLRQLGRRPGTEGYGWSAVRDPGAIFDGFRLLVNLEQKPDPENRIVLTDRRDELGVPRAALHWRWRDAEQAGLVQLRERISSALETARFGRVRQTADARPDPNAHHHAGTTRMHESPAHGVTDADGRVHGTDQLFIAGASLFPTAGFANPTLTIVALALRLADHLRRTL